MNRAVLFVLLCSSLAGCWITEKEIRKKVKEYEDSEETEPPVADTAAPSTT